MTKLVSFIIIMCQYNQIFLGYTCVHCRNYK